MPLMAMLALAMRTSGVVLDTWCTLRACFSRTTSSASVFPLAHQVWSLAARFHNRQIFCRLWESGLEWDDFFRSAHSLRSV
mmetsp:Transcript_55339/g.159101  ORF Transcript_55339/g.159101 Transcript_55339/m.159101 type:complete len:81 (-) Transcript_55339:377-619(-)